MIELSKVIAVYRLMYTVARFNICNPMNAGWARNTSFDKKVCEFVENYAVTKSS